MNNKKSRRRYSDAFRQQTVQRLMESGEPVATFASSVGIDRTILQKWRKRFLDAQAPTLGTDVGDSVGELVALKREMERIKTTLGELREIVRKSLVARHRDLL